MLWLPSGDGWGMNPKKRLCLISKSGDRRKTILDREPPRSALADHLFSACLSVPSVQASLACSRAAKTREVFEQALTSPRTCVSACEIFIPWARCLLLSSKARESCRFIRGLADAGLCCFLKAQTRSFA